MIGNRMTAIHVRGRGWTYNVSGHIGLDPHAAEALLHAVYGLSFREAREKLTAARNARVVPLPAPLAVVQ